MKDDFYITKRSVTLHVYNLPADQLIIDELKEPIEGRFQNCKIMLSVRPKVHGDPFLCLEITTTKTEEFCDPKEDTHGQASKTIDNSATGDSTDSGG
jgi:hypothetical protein